MIGNSHGEALAARPELSAWHARQLAGHVAAAQKLRPTSLVIEIGSRDGWLLKTYQASGVPVLGIEPTVRLAELARLENGIPTLCRHFNQHLAEHLEGCGQQADVVHVHHVLPVLVDVEAFLAGLAIVLRPSGVAVVDVPYVKHLVDRGELTVPPYRMWSYFSLTSLTRTLARYGLVAHDVEQNADAGGSLRLFVGKRGDTSARVTALLAEEADWGVDQPETYVGHLPPHRAKVA